MKTNLFIYLGFYVAFNTVQVISRRVVGRAEETNTYSLSGFCTVNYQQQATTSFPTLGRAGNRTPASEVGGESVTTLPPWPLNEDKRTQPTRTLTCLGICIDISRNTLSIDSVKIEAIYDQRTKILPRHTISKKQLQSYLRTLLYFHKCVKPARFLATFRKNSHRNKFQISTEIKQDIHWFLQFLPQFHGVSILKKMAN